MNASYPPHEIRVVLFESIHARATQLLGKEGYTLTTHAGMPSGKELIELAQGAHIVGIRSKTQLDAEFFAAAPDLGTVGCFCIGTNQVDLKAASDRGVVVFNAPFANTRSVAELTMAEIIALHRGLVQRSMALHQGRWTKSAKGCHEVRGRTLGIVGYGRIGSQASVLAEALGMRVVFHDIVDCLAHGNAARLPSLDEVLSASDVVTLHVPATPETKNLIGRRELGLMKPGSFLINNARGDVVDLVALREALDSQHLAGAAIDVFPSEPASNDTSFEVPLAGCANVILTPHVGGSTAEAQENIAVEVCTKLAKFMNNGSTTTSVNFPEVELPQLHPKHHRILHYHHNVPGVLSRMHRIISDLGVNISAEFLQSNPRHSYVIMDVEATHGGTFLEQLREIPETIRARMLWCP